MKIAHFSDLHLASPGGVAARRLLGKRAMGWLNLRLHRGGLHRAATVTAIAHAIGRIGVEHAVVTGDLTNLALEDEFERARDVFARDLGLPAERVTVVPGNHDAYTRGALAARRFEAYLGAWMESDLPELAADAHGGRFPVVKLRGPAAFIGLSSAVPRAPLVAAGEIGPAQMDALRRALRHPEVAGRTAVVAVHHPPVHRWSRAKGYLEGLRDAPALLDALRGMARGLVLHGHLHRRIHRVLPTDAGAIHQIGATSASLHHDAPDRMAGFNVYEIDGASPVRIEAHVYRVETGTFQADSVPKYV